jgi:aspartyl-tRNA(Asn)/glutamyl-tRNA(Gln) amidotransferase subunit C
MASQLTRDEVERIAALARLTLTSEEASRFARDLTAILEYAADIARVDTTDVPPAGVDVDSVWREDTPAASLPRQIVIDEAPDAAGETGLFRVPKVL